MAVVFAQRVLTRAKAAAGRAIERHYEIETSEPVDAETLGHVRKEYVYYQASDWLLLPVALGGLGLGREDVFADIGCGKGRVVLQAAVGYPFSRVIGVERSPVLAAEARSNLARLGAGRRKRAGQVAIEEADVLGWTVPDDLTVAYLYNPFRGDVFAAALERLIASYDRRPRRMRIVYAAPLEHEQVVATGRCRELPARCGRLLRHVGFDATSFRRYEICP